MDGYRGAGGGCAGPGRVHVQAARKGLSWPWMGTGRQEGDVPALGGCRPPGRVSAGLGWVQAARPLLAASTLPGPTHTPPGGLYPPRAGTDPSWWPLPSQGRHRGCRRPGGVCAGPGGNMLPGVLLSCSTIWKI